MSDAMPDWFAENVESTQEADMAALTWEKMTPEEREQAVRAHDAATTITKPEDLRPFKVDPEGFWLVERMAGGDGYDVMDKASEHRWVALSGWGRDGWDFLEWPYYVGYVRNTAEGFEFATNCEGDVDVWRFPTKELRERALDLWAFLNWERKGESWVQGYTADAIPDHLRGPYSPDRHA